MQCVQIYWLKTPLIYDMWILQLGRCLWLKISWSLWFCCWTRLGCGLWRFDWSRICFQAHSHGCSQQSALHQLWDWQPQFSDAKMPLSALLYGPLLRAAQSTAAEGVFGVCVHFFFRANEKEHASFCNLMTEGTCCHYAVFHSLEPDHWIQSTLRERTKPGGELSGVRDIWGPS